MMATEMANTVQVPARVAGRSSSMALLVLIAGWLVPGAGHLLLGKWVRGLLLLVTLVAIRRALQGKLYSPNTGDLLHILNFAGDLGTGLMYVIAKTFDLGAAA